MTIADFNKKLICSKYTNNGKIRLEFDGLYWSVTIYKIISEFDEKKRFKKIAHCTVGNGLYGVLYALQAPLDGQIWNQK